MIGPGGTIMHDRRNQRDGRAHARSVGRAALLATLVVLAAGSARAQYSMMSNGAPRFEWRGSISADYRNEFDTKTDGGDEFRSWRVGMGGDFGGPINESILLGVRAGYHYASYNFNLQHGSGDPPRYGSNELPHDPWGSINTADLAPSMTVLVGDRIAVVAAVPIRWSAEVGSRRNAASAGISGIVLWQVTDSFRVGGGIGVTSQLEANAETFPIVSLDWQITDALQLQTEGSWIQGGNATLLWGPNRAVRLSLSAGYERNRFRLDDNGFRADRNGIGEITAVPIDVGLRFEFYEGAFFDFRVGLAVAGRFRVENDHGNKLYDQQYDPSPRIGLGLTIPFGLPGD
jgi:hypothetical protein